MTDYKEVKIEPMCDVENENYAIATVNIKEEPSENVFVELDLSSAAERQDEQTDIHCFDINQNQEHGLQKSDVKCQREPSHRRVSYSQLEQLWEFLSKNRYLAFGFNKTAQAREFSRQMWENIAPNLNSHANGATKDWRGWCKYWNDYKCKIKKLAAANRAAQNMTSEGAPPVRSMFDIEKKFLSMIQSDFGSSWPRIRVEPLDEISQESNDGAALTFMPTPVPSTPLPSKAPLPVTAPLSSNPPVPGGAEQPEQQPTSSIVRQTQTPRRTRRRRRREFPIRQETFLRPLIRISERRMEIEKKNSETLVNLLQEIRDIKFMLQSRLS